MHLPLISIDMKTYRIFIIPVFFVAFFSSCENDIDKEKPNIDLTIPGAFPVNCDTIFFGESFELHVLFTDNVELGSYSIDIHHNFDHHSHSTEVNECSLDPVNDPVNPITYIEDFNIPEARTSFETIVTIPVPSSGGNGLFDEGDYHFFISLTDKEGWSAQKGLSIKMLHR